MDGRKTIDALLMTPRDPRSAPICLCGYPCLADRVRDALIAAYTDAFWRKVGQTGWLLGHPLIVQAIAVDAMARVDSSEPT